jgi:hypothetical protein
MKNNLYFFAEFYHTFFRLNSEWYDNGLQTDFLFKNIIITNRQEMDDLRDEVKDFLRH